MQAPHRDLGPRDDAERFLVGLLDALWKRYSALVEPARRYEALAARGGKPWRNDHVAFRTLAWQRPASGTFSVARLFEALGYAAAGCYAFPDKKLSALHFRHRNPAFPKLFVSELRCWELPEEARAALARSADRAEPGPAAGLLARLRAPRPGDEALLRDCLALFSRPWPAPRREDVAALDRLSQYGAWVLVHGHAVNHFTGAVDDIEAAVAAMKAEGVAMKAEIEGAPGSALRQSSTEAVVLPVEVEGGTMPWTYAYFELAQRSGGFEGFLGDQASGLFEMTRFAGKKG